MILKFQACLKINIERKLCSATIFEDFCTAIDHIDISPLLDGAEIIKEIHQKNIKNSGFDFNFRVSRKLLNSYVPQ